MQHVTETQITITLSEQVLSFMQSEARNHGQSVEKCIEKTVSAFVRTALLMRLKTDDKSQ
jgi:hypothetical protein